MPGKISELYYYTTVETMRFILQNGNIYATNLKYMNDSEEYSNGLIELRKILNEEFPKTKNVLDDKALAEQIEGHPEIYSISFSTQRDLLSQWSMYSGESGVSLRMNFRSKQNYRFYVEGQKEQEEAHPQKSVPKQVYYVTESAMKATTYRAIKKKVVEKIRNTYGEVTLGDMAGENAMAVWQDMTPYVKRYEFFQEGEYRLAFSVWNFIKPPRVDYRYDKHVLKPYLDVECEGGWPVEEILVGPGFNQKAVFMSLKHYMAHAKLKVKELPGKKFRDRCELYLKKDGSIPKAVAASAWKKYEKRLVSGDADKRYDCFEEMLKEIMSNNRVNRDYKSYLTNRHLSKAGILITKSEIPYIY